MADKPTCPQCQGPNTKHLPRLRDGRVIAMEWVKRHSAGGYVAFARYFCRACGACWCENLRLIG